MTKYKVINTRDKSDVSDYYDWWYLMRWIKFYDLADNLQRDINVVNEWCWQGYCVVVDELGLKVSYEEVMKSINLCQTRKRRDYSYSRIHPETEYGTPVDKSRYYNRDTTYQYRKDPVPFVGGRQWYGNYRKSSYNKKYHADLQEYGVTPRYIDRWGDEIHKATSRSWKRNTKKRKQWG